MNTAFLIIAMIFMAVIFIAGLYERFVNMPEWFSNPPASFALIREHTPKAKKIHIPLQILFLISFIIALILNWDAATVRTYMLFSIGFFILIVISTIIYFAKEIIYFSSTPQNAPATQELKNRAMKWEKSTTIRNVLQLLGVVFLIIAVFNLD